MTGLRTLKRSLTLVALAVGAAISGSTASAAIPGQTPFPAEKIGDVFAAAQTATTDGTVSDYFTPGSTVVFRAYAIDRKLHKVLGAGDVKYFYVTIPTQPNLKLKYDPKATGATALMPWIGTWTVPATYAAGRVDFKVFVKTNAKRKGQFVQLPVEASQLTITASPPPLLTPAPLTAAAITGSPDVSLYVDTVNGTRPRGRGAKANRVHPDERLQARRAARRPRLGRRARHRQHPVERERHQGHRDDDRTDAGDAQLGRARRNDGRRSGTGRAPGTSRATIPSAS